MAKYYMMLLFVVTLAITAFPQTVTFRVFDRNGNISTFEEIIQNAQNSEVIFFGELHNNSLVHWLQLQLLKNIHDHQKHLILAGEFFERDDQINIDEWFSGLITDKNFEAEAKLWNNYLTDYKPLTLFAKQNQIPFIASNIPRKYASAVSRHGIKVLDTVSQKAKQFFPPLPIEVDKTLPGYAGMKDFMHGSEMDLDHLIEAQAIKDATMAYSLFDHIGKNKMILHINGNYHSQNEEGIIWYLRKRFPKIPILTISTVEQEELDGLHEKSKGIADYILVLPKDSHKSY